MTTRPQRKCTRLTRTGCTLRRDRPYLPPCRNPLTRTLVLPIYAPGLLLALANGLLIPVLPLYAESFAVSLTLVGLVVGAQGLGMLIGDVPAGAVLRRVGQKWTMLLGIGGLTLSMLAMGLAPTFWSVFAFGITGGVSQALWWLARHAYLTTATQSGARARLRGRTMSIFGGINRIGVFIGPFVGGFLANAYGLRAPFVLYALLAVVSLIFPALFVPHRESLPPGAEAPPAHAGHGPNYLAGWVAVLRAQWRVLASAGAGMLMGQMVRVARRTIVPLYAANILLLDVDTIGVVLGIAGGVDMIMFPLAGWVMDRFGRKWAFVPCFALQGVGMALIPFTAGAVSLLAVICFIGLANGLGSGTMMTLGADLAPPGGMSEFLGLWRLIGDAGQSGAPLIVGAVADALTLSAAAWVLAAVGLGAALVLGTRVPETLERSPAKGPVAEATGT